MARPAAPGRGWRRAATAALVACGCLSALALKGGMPQAAASRGGEGRAVPEEDPLTKELAAAIEEVEQLSQEAAAMEEGAPDFAQRAQGLLERCSEPLRPLVDAALEAVFIQQLLDLSQELLERYESDTRQPVKAMEKADKDFVARAEELRCAGSDWSYTPERIALRTALTSAFQQERDLGLERKRLAQAQRTTAAVIGKLQQQMEEVGEKLNGVGTSGPWVVWTSYRIPGTNLRMSGKYQQGRTNIEIGMVPARDPANAEAGFVEGLSPQNVGLSLNLGV